MNVITALLIVGGIWLIMILLCIMVLWWMRTNDTIIQISELKEGVNMSSGGRHRVRDNKPLISWKRSKVEPKPEYEKKIYAFNDFFSRYPLDIKYDAVKDYFIVSESMPFIGIKQTLKLVKKGEFYHPWRPVATIDDKNIIKPTVVAWVEQAREDLFENTKPTISKQEMINKYIIPISLIVLAIACMIFFPKMYDSVISQGNAAVTSAFNSFSGFLNEYVPLG